jgi:FG-GAP repeat
LRPISPLAAFLHFFLLLIIVLTILLSASSLATASDTAITRMSQLPPEAQSSLISALATLTEANGQANDMMGISVAVEGNTVVVGTPQQGAYADLPGAVYVFTKPASGWANMTQTATLTASDENSNGHGNQLGSGVAISGDTIVASAPWSGNPLFGAVYVYTKPAGGWRDATENARLTSTDLDSIHGGFAYLAVNGNTIVSTIVRRIGGAAYVWVKPAGGWQSATQTAKLSPSTTAADWFGYYIGISADTVVVGCPYQIPGEAYVFVKPGTGWHDMTETAQLRASDERGIDEFGQSVAINGSQILVGSPFAVVNSLQTGAAYVFLRPKTGWKTTTAFAAKLTASDGDTQDGFGMSVAINRSTAVVGATAHPSGGPGAIYVFSRPASGWATTSESASATASSGADFGYSVAASGSTIVTGEPFALVGGVLQGSAFVFGQ